MKRRKNDKPRTSRAARSEKQNAPPGADPLFPRLSYEDSQAISLQRKIDIALWSKGNPYPPALAKKFELARPYRRDADNSVAKRIIAEKVELRRKIAGSPPLVKDFEFFLEKMDWYPEKFLQRLYLESNIMHADRQTILRRESARVWPIDQDTLKTILGDISVAADQIERLNQTNLSPSQSEILRNKTGVALSPRDAKHLLGTFRDLPEILRFYCGEFSRKFEVRTRFWSKLEQQWPLVVDRVKQDSLYEHIRLATSENEYNAVRLHRLVSASREVQGLPPIKWRAFVIWLNKLKKRAGEHTTTPQAWKTKTAVN